MRKRLDYVCLQPTRQGQASFAHVTEIVAGLRTRGWDVRLVEPPLPRPGLADGFRRLFRAATVQLGYWLRCRFRPAEFVYIRSHFLTLPTALFARIAGATVIQELNGPTDDIYDAWPKLRPLRPLLDFLARSQLQMADAVVVVTPGLGDYTRTFARRNREIHVIGNGANVELFHPSDGVAPDIAGARDGRPYVVFTGALASWQGIDTVLAAATSAAWPDTIDLVIAGDGKERTRVESAARDSGGRIRWLGTVPYDDSSALVAGSVAALVPKAYAPSCAYGLSPLKLYEAMACGVPVLASDLPGLTDTLREHDCGIVFPSGDAAALAGAVARVAADLAAAREMGARGRAAAVAHYSWDVRSAETERVLVGLAEAKGASAAKQ